MSHQGHTKMMMVNIDMSQFAYSTVVLLLSSGMKQQTFKKHVCEIITISILKYTSSQTLWHYVNLVYLFQFPAYSVRKLQG